jgi:hypothetical protein
MESFVFSYAARRSWASPGRFLVSEKHIITSKCATLTIFRGPQAAKGLSGKVVQVYFCVPLEAYFLLKYSKSNSDKINTVNTHAVFVVAALERHR